MLFYGSDDSFSHAARGAVDNSTVVHYPHFPASISAPHLLSDPAVNLTALNKLAPAAESNKLRFQQILGVTLQLQDILCGVSLPEVPNDGTVPACKGLGNAPTP